jgi:hypothetical protein
MLPKSVEMEMTPTNSLQSLAIAVSPLPTAATSFTLALG